MTKLTLKTLTVPASQLAEVAETLNNKAILDFVYHGELVTIVFQEKPYVLMRNLSAMSVKELRKLCKKEGIATSGEYIGKVSRSAESLMEEFNRLKDQAESKDDYDRVMDNWKFIVFNLEYLIEDKIHLRSVLVDRGIEPTTMGMKKGLYPKQKLINLLFHSGADVLDQFNFCLSA